MRMAVFDDRRKRGMGSHHAPNQGMTDEWLTPPEIIRALGSFDLDPCCPHNMPWSTATESYAEPHGLVKPWHGRVWMNPPYGRETKKWVQKLANHGNGIALLMARTETGIFFPWVWERADAVLFIKGRLNFYDVHGRRSDKNCGAPSVLVAYGCENADSLDSCAIAGKVVRLRDRLEEGVAA